MNIKPEEAYKIIGDYDRHYSTVRMTLTTFLLSFGFALASFILKDSDQWYGTLIGAVVPFFFLIIAYKLSIHFQRLTASCRKLQELLEQERLDQFSRQVLYKQKIVTGWDTLDELLSYEQINKKLGENTTEDKLSPEFKQTAWEKTDLVSLNREVVIGWLNSPLDGKPSDASPCADLKVDHLYMMSRGGNLYKHLNAIKGWIDRDEKKLSELLMQNMFNDNSLLPSWLNEPKVTSKYHSWGNVYLEFRKLLEEVYDGLKIQKPNGHKDAPHAALIFFICLYVVAVGGFVAGKVYGTKEACIVVDRIVKVQDDNHASIEVTTPEALALKGLMQCGKIKKTENQ